MSVGMVLRVIGFVLGFTATLFLFPGCSQENERIAAVTCSSADGVNIKT